MKLTKPTIVTWKNRNWYVVDYQESGGYLWNVQLIAVTESTNLANRMLVDIDELNERDIVRIGRTTDLPPA